MFGWGDGRNKGVTGRELEQGLTPSSSTRDSKGGWRNEKAAYLVGVRRLWDSASPVKDSISGGVL